MAFSKTVKKSERGVHQALNKDYKKSGFDKGHLAPVYHANSQKCADATFTLTNAAPQVHEFNQIWWDQEKEIANFLNNSCTKNGYRAYVVTGVVPPGNKQAINNRVYVPSHFWTAFCCLYQTDAYTVKCASGGAIGKNYKKGNIRTMPVSALESKLKKLYGTASTFIVFPLG